MGTILATISPLAIEINAEDTWIDINAVNLGQGFSFTIDSCLDFKCEGEALDFSVVTVKGLNTKFTVCTEMIHSDNMSGLKV